MMEIYAYFGLEPDPEFNRSYLRKTDHIKYTRN